MASICKIIAGTQFEGVVHSFVNYNLVKFETGLSMHKLLGLYSQKGLAKDQQKISLSL